VLALLLINAFQAFDEFYNLLASSSGYPPYARPPLVYLYYIALGQQQDLGHGSAGAVILAAIIAIFTLVQGRFVGFGEQSARDERRARRRTRRARAARAGAR
jgi:multiple sugar transport system permease protein